MSPEDWRPIATAEPEVVVLLGWWFALPGFAPSWETDVDVPNGSATNWMPIVSPRRPR